MLPLHFTCFSDTTNVGGIIGGVVGAVAGIVVVAVIVIFVLRRQNKLPCKP
jgi:predicted PurR-regulated permease PerM